MRIPLDYYRILGLPIQATADQLRQAHRDRTAQLPRREYSDIAIEARKHLIDEAHGVLSDLDQRRAYDKGFLAKTYEYETDSQMSDLKPDLKPGFKKAAEDVDGVPRVEEHTPSVEIDDKDFIGALLILYELGEYEQVVKISAPYLSNGAIGLRDGRFGDPELILPDVILTAGLAYLELGREQWQQGQHEKAADSLEIGQNLLLQENLFPNLRGDIQADLYKLRPHRILELLQRPNEQANERRQGLQLLREMLQERGGIDGHGDDHSGLNVEDFLRFVQHLRRYLTTTEQQGLFEVEARRPSAVATYLTVYALIAQGFANAQPALIRKAKLMLMQLGRRQDVHLEKAVCSLLLGQTEEASRALELSQEQEPIAFIREQSKDAPDLLPGLCLYAERWLQDEVFPHFRDLVSRTVSLKDYFADTHVQSYLEALSTEVGNANEWVVVHPRRTGSTTAPAQRITPTSTEVSFSGSQDSTLGTATLAASTIAGSAIAGSAISGSGETMGTPAPTSFEATSTADLGLGTTSLQDQQTIDPIAYESLPPDEANPASRLSASRGRRGGAEPEVSVGSGDRRSVPGRRNSKFDPVKLRRLLFLGAVSVLAVWLLLWLLSSIFGLFSKALQGGESGSTTLQGEQALVRLDQPPILIPEPEPVVATTGEITPEMAEQVIRKWLAIKEKALGPERTIEEIREILVEPSLSQWVNRAETLKQEGAHRIYKHKLTIKSVKVNESDPNRAVAETEVQEAVQFYENGQVSGSQDDALQIQYQLIRKEGQPWRIQDWQVQ
ncbi:MAG: IMS domain-containing protein [Microcoleaceae cyanobacterium]